jgi:GT2 family glycosyltransferase
MDVTSTDAAMIPDSAPVSGDVAEPARLGSPDPGYCTAVRPMAVAVVSYNTCDLLRECIRSVQSEAPSEIVVVDNASGDGSSEMVERDFPSVVLRRNQTNIGYGAAANQAITNCTAPYVLLLNCDTWVHSGALAALGAYLDRHPEVGLVGPRLITAAGVAHPSCFPFPSPLDFLLDVTNLYRLIQYVPYVRDRVLRTWQHTRARAVPWVHGSALALRRSAFQSVGGFDEAFFMYVEEVDLCYRLVRAGWAVHFTPVATVVHVGGASTRQQRADMLVQMYASLVRFYRLHYSDTLRFELSALIIAVALGRLARDWFLRRLAADPHRRALLDEQIEAWRRLLHGEWRQAYG